jgi:hypothetical protein
MRRRRQLLALIAATACLLSIVGAILYISAKHEPAFYRRGEIVSSALRRQLAEEFLRCSSEVYNLMANGKPWALNITQDQINGYLQDEMSATGGLFSYPDNVSDPRVEFDTDRIRIGFRYGVGTWSAIVSVDLRTWLVAKEPNTVALELCGLSVGGLPLGSHAMMEYVTDAAREWNADVTWYRNNAHPVALIRLQANQNRPTLQMKRFEITDGQAHIHGKPTVDAQPATEVTGG